MKKWNVSVSPTSDRNCREGVHNVTAIVSWTTWYIRCWNCNEIRYRLGPRKAFKNMHEALVEYTKRSDRPTEAPAGYREIKTHKEPTDEEIVSTIGTLINIINSSHS